ncbi:alpha/beta-hydrolase [Hyaloscypha variabilis F]|uniref:Alpha/beta-hydrolase n=1 Tax=Hyaloscypha variabilis (strain UAMH 11265 / GT02V1 / F) TaxID=1149755 RepID=A0A2J6RG28_HYAVF|nr:alpha/beta-hydrolase [Hyaloscypha variabilis F]
MEASVANIGMGEEIRPYKIHVSSKYLDLTRKKLELTRLPHELLLPKVREWEYGTPKAEIEPLIDFWLEHYTWRSQESHLNNTLPQFRTAIKVPSSDTSVPLRIHFLHLKSPHQHAVPLLLVPTFPLTNLSLAPLFAPLTHPRSPTSTQPFHLVVPSIPGLGFSDAFQCEDGLLEKTAEVFDTLMQRLGYEFYIASATGSGRESPSGIDYHLARIIGENFPDSCLGVHLVEPCVERPKFRTETLGWAKFALAGFFHASIFGYQERDWAALRESRKIAKQISNGWRINDEESPLLRAGAAGGYGAVDMVGLREPNTFAYAFCDSPVGLLSLVCSAIRRKSPQHELTRAEIIDITQLAWLPGPEGAARFWAASIKEVEVLGKRKRIRARVGVTVFGSDGVDGDYVCPAWADAKHDVVFSQRATGKAGLSPWERTDVLIAGIRGLAREIDLLDGRLKAKPLEQVVIAVEEVIPEEAGEAEVVGEGDHGMQMDVESPDTVVAVDMS